MKGLGFSGWGLGFGIYQALASPHGGAWARREEMASGMRLLSVFVFLDQENARKRSVPVFLKPRKRTKADRGCS